MSPNVKNELALFEEQFLRLPRELRDLVYANFYASSGLMPLEDINANPASMALFATSEGEMNPGFAAEILEAFYTHHTFSVTFSNCSQPVNWGPHSQYQEYIRRLVIHTQEVDFGETASLVSLEHRCLEMPSSERSDWERLLELPRLEELTIQLQKRLNDRFSWACFSPILIRLRERFPRVKIVFKVSFDTLLERFWTDPMWENYTEPGNVVEEPYDPMGFVDVTELIEPPTEDDLAYVLENFSEQGETIGRDILRGLLDEKVPQRRILALHYVVKEPALLRVRMVEHYGVYKKMKADRADHIFG